MSIAPRIRLAFVTVFVALACGFAPSVFAAPSQANGSERIPFRQDDDDLGNAMWRAALGMAAIALLAGGAVYFVKRRGLAPATPVDAAKPVRILQSLRAGPKTTLLVVQFGGQRVLLGQGDHGLQVLATQPAEGES